MLRIIVGSISFVVFFLGFVAPRLLLVLVAAVGLVVAVFFMAKSAWASPPLKRGDSEGDRRQNRGVSPLRAWLEENGGVESGPEPGRVQSRVDFSAAPPVRVEIPDPRKFSGVDKPVRQEQVIDERESIRRALRALDWFQFEKLVTLYYRTQGYSVERVGGAKPDGGVDLIVEHEGKRYVVQCKHWKRWAVALRDIREFLGTLTDQRIPNGIYVTMCGYTNDARDFACRHGIVLFEEAQLVQCILDLEERQLAEVRGLLADRRKFCPGCESEMVLRPPRMGRNGFWGCSRYPRCKFILNLDDKE